MTRQMPAGAQIAFTKSWLERQGIEAQTIDVEAHIDPSLSYEENIKLMKREFKLGGGRSRQKATRDLSAAECDVAIGNYHAGYNHGSMTDACACGHPDACVDLERAGREAATKPKATPTQTISPAKEEYLRKRDRIDKEQFEKWGVGTPPTPRLSPPTPPAAAPKRKAAKPKKKAAKPAKAKPQKPAPAGIALTATQKKRLNATGRITVKRNGKFVTITKKV